MKVVGKNGTERRRNRRPQQPPIRLRICGQPYKTTEWTLGGFMVAPYTDNHKAGNIIEVDIYIDAGKETIDHTVEGMVAQVDTEELKLAAQFIDLEPEVVELLDGWLTGRLRRQMARAPKQKKKPSRINAPPAKFRKALSRYPPSPRRVPPAPDRWPIRGCAHRG